MTPVRNGGGVSVEAPCARLEHATGRARGARQCASGPRARHKLTVSARGGVLTKYLQPAQCPRADTGQKWTATRAAEMTAPRSRTSLSYRTLTNA